MVKGGLSRISLLFPLPFVDDELPLEMGQELEVLLLLGHAHHLNSETGLAVNSAPYCKNPQAEVFRIIL